MDVLSNAEGIKLDDLWTKLRNSRKAAIQLDIYPGGEISGDVVPAN